MHYVIVGNSTAGIGAAEGIRQVDGEGVITIVGEEPYHVYSRPLIAHWIAGEVDEAGMRYRGLDFYDQHHISTRLGQRATALDTAARTVALANGEKLSYDKLLIATGSVQRFPPIPGAEWEGVCDFWTFDQAKVVRERASPAKRAVVVGAGLVGLQAAYGLREAGLEVVVVELLDVILGRILDTEGAQIAQRILEANGIQVITGCSVAEIEGDAKRGVTGVLLDDGERIDCQLVIKATGVAPNTVLVKDTPIKVNQGILVDEFFETSQPGVYAAGDVAETWDICRAQEFVNANCPNAREQGRLAGRAMAGEPTSYAGSISMTSIPLYGWPVVSLGLIESDGAKDSYQYRVRSKPERHIYRKLVFKDDRLVGAIMIGDISNIGFVCDLIKKQTPVGIVEDAILGHKAQFYYFRRALHQEALEGVDRPWPESLGSTQRYEKRFDEEKWKERERGERKW
ncbi:MAG: NAD(P)/FAD-dependent oxidoreductase [Anaerolineae bacterium]